MKKSKLFVGLALVTLLASCSVKSIDLAQAKERATEIAEKTESFEPTDGMTLKLNLQVDMTSGEYSVKSTNKIVAATDAEGNGKFQIESSADGEKEKMTFYIANIDDVTTFIDETDKMYSTNSSVISSFTDSLTTLYGVTEMAYTTLSEVLTLTDETAEGITFQSSGKGSLVIKEEMSMAELGMPATAKAVITYSNYNLTSVTAKVDYSDETSKLKVNLSLNVSYKASFKIPDYSSYTKM